MTACKIQLVAPLGGTEIGSRSCPWHPHSAERLTAHSRCNNTMEKTPGNQLFSSINIPMDKQCISPMKYREQPQPLLSWTPVGGHS